MPKIEIPEASFNFSDIARDIARKVCEDDLDSYRLMLFENTQYTDYSNLDLKLRSTFLDLASPNDQLIYLSEILSYLSRLEIQEKNAIPFIERYYLSITKNINHAQYYFYKQLSSIGYNVDTNAFSSDEMYESNSKIDEIIESLDNLKMGQSALGEEIQDLKDELASLKSEYILGKKTWKQKATGILFSYFATKSSDAAWDIIKPYLADFIAQNGHEIIKYLLA